MYMILPNLYQGGKLYSNQEEFTAVVDLTTTATLDMNFVDIYVSIPIEDGLFPGIKWLETTTGILSSLVENYKTYVHCKEGISRSVMVVAAFLMKNSYWDLDKAMNFIAKTNSRLNPNPRFMEGLKQWQKHLKI